jgi:hypothetical protein
MSDSTPGAAITFVESAIFTQRVIRLGLEEALRRLQLELAANPTAGRVDPGTGGLRKVRLADPARGRKKGGGARARYLWVPGRRLAYLLFVYAKNENATLRPDQKKALASVVHAIKRELAGRPG